MFELDHAIDRWKRDLQGLETVSSESLEELEDHLRAEIADRVEAGESTEQAFAHAMENLGSPDDLAREFAKVAPSAGRRLRRVGWAMYAVSFFLPVYQWGVLWARDSVRGWEAFLMTLDPEAGVFGIASGLTNWVMLATLSPRWRRRRGLGPVMLGAGLLNAGWLLWIDSMRDLHVGYYAWWTSFVLVGTALWMEHRKRTRGAHMWSTGCADSATSKV